MLTYWLLYLLPILMALGVKHSKKLTYFPWVAIGMFFILVIGFRENVGCDWCNYVGHYERTVGLSFSQAFEEIKDPAHTFFNWLSGKLDLGIYGVNTLYATIFVLGLMQFSRTQPYPWLAFSVAVPYMVVMVSMGYSRQGVALGLFMMAITYLEKGKFKSYIFWVFLAALFHKTALVLLPFGLFLNKGNMWFRMLLMIPVFYGGWDLLLAEKQEDLWVTYVEQQMQSSGAQIRVMMNLVPAILLLVYRKKWKANYSDYPFWFWIAIASIGSFFLVGFATTAVDRISLYFIPLQLVVYARLPLFLRSKMGIYFPKVMILLMYAFVLFVWLFFATHAHCWLPYENVLWSNF